MSQPRIELTDPRVTQLARARQQLAHNGMLHPTWDELAHVEREESLPYARAYLEAAVLAGLVPSTEEASVPSSELRDRIAAALSEAGAFCGECGFEPGETGCSDCVRVRAMYTDAVLATVQPELDRLRAELEQARADIERIRTRENGVRTARRQALRELEQARQQQAALATVRVWRNEDGREFLFADSVRAALGLPTAAQPSA